MASNIKLDNYVFNDHPPPPHPTTRRTFFFFFFATSDTCSNRVFAYAEREIRLFILSRSKRHVVLSIEAPRADRETVSQSVNHQFDTGKTGSTRGLVTTIVYVAPLRMHRVLSDASTLRGEVDSQLYVPEWIRRHGKFTTS